MPPSDPASTPAPTPHGAAAAHGNPAERPAPGGPELVLVHPEIPANTGSIARLAAATGARLHLIEPLGFSLDDRYLKRAGLDYWPMVDLWVHANWEAACAFFERDSDRPLHERLRLFSARGGDPVFEVPFQRDDLLLFGSESSGLPEELLREHAERRVYVPVKPEVRSLNLSSVATLSLYLSWVRAGVPLPDNDGLYTPHPDSVRDLFAADIARRSDAR